MRPGRLDRILYVGPPDHEGRKEILKIRMSAMKVDSAVDLDVIADLVSRLSFPPFRAYPNITDRRMVVQEQKSPHYAKRQHCSQCKRT